MTNFTQKQLLYIEARVNGLNRTQAAIHAGSSRASANRYGPLMEQRADIKAAIASGKKKAKKNGSLQSQVEATLGGASGKVRGRGDGEPRMKPKYASSLDLLQHTYNNPLMPDSVRMRAAEQALPYEHGRIGEKGKKESAKDRAKEVVKGRNKFSPKAAPNLTVVGGTG